MLENEDLFLGISRLKIHSTFQTLLYELLVITILKYRIVVENLLKIKFVMINWRGERIVAISFHCNLIFHGHKGGRLF